MHIGYWWESQKERAVGRPRRRWVNNIEMGVKRDRIGCYGLD
jgi:hypothetical protein